MLGRKSGCRIKGMMAMKRKIKMFGVCFLAFFSLIMSVQAIAKPELTLTGPDVRVRDTSSMTPLKNSKKVIIQGIKQNGGCVFTVVIHKAANESAKVVRDLALNLKTCQKLVEEGEATGHELAIVAEGQSETDSVTAEKVDGNILGESKGSFAALASASVTFKTIWYDPINIPVNSVADTITWSYDGSRVLSYSGSDSRTWFKPTGWWESYHAIYAGYLNSGAASVWTNDSMRNQLFCNPLALTGVEYYENRVIGFKDGSATGSVTTGAWGDCSSLLWVTTILQ